MNIGLFDRLTEEMEQNFDSTSRVLVDSPTFDWKDRNRFDQGINKLMSLLNNDFMKEITTSKLAAHRFARLSTLESKIIKIRQLILTNCHTPYFLKKINHTVLPLLRRRIIELKASAYSMERLPFNAGILRDQFLRKVKNELALEGAGLTLRAEKEFFHLLGNDLANEKLKDIEISYFEYNLEIYSLVSWIEVLDHFIQTGSDFDRNIGIFLKTSIEKAIPLALKQSFVCDFSHINHENPSADKLYLFDFCHLKSTEQHQKTEFDQKYQLDKPSTIPSSVLINEMAWDAVDTINQMGKGDIRILMFGTCHHRITIEVKCLELSEGESPGEYEYKIINGGEGAQRCHRFKMENNEEFVRPVAIRHLPKAILSYPFFEQLTRISLQRRSIDEFYDLHLKFLVFFGGGQIDFDSNPWVKLHQFSTCTYSCVEAWITTYLTNEQLHRINIIKAELCTAKQKNVVKLLEAECGEGGWILKSMKSKGFTKNKFLAIKKKRLKENKLLLTLGQAYKEKMESQQIAKSDFSFAA